MVNGLVAAGYVTRTPLPQDKRSVVVALTDLGRARHDERQTLLTEQLEATLAEFDVDHLESASEILLRLAALYDRL